MDVNKKCANSIIFKTFKALNKVVVSYNDKRVEEPKEIISEFDITYNLFGANCKLDIHKPKDMKKHLPILIYYHGGGFAVGDKSIYSTFCKILSSKGFVVFNINYELTEVKPHPASIIDCVRGANWVYKYGELYGGDINNIFIAGDSSGGHITGLIGALCSNKEMYNLYNKKYNIKISFKESLRAIGILCGLNDFSSCYNLKVPFIKRFAKMLYNCEDVVNSNKIKEISVIKNMTEKFPKTFITTTENDPVYCESVLIEKELIKREIKYKMLFFDKSHRKLWHVYQLNQTFPESKRCLDEMVEFFRNNMIL
ncbi:alpha/beta hydrolase [Eubacterium multiforme]|uniref:Acetyl esterase/lipase n=1 Tax=Eubacterium multiforme TaxID=83339 RepID=A0ABT9UT54_9FIRM|nr:alpha/beta hydrolase [Eubacterium multiforme]MDQ0149475.1 acetyl esterase/lipase [Eubacterium multiforme]